jgi:hypothetical protein
MRRRKRSCYSGFVPDDELERTPKIVVREPDDRPPRREAR